LIPTTNHLDPTWVLGYDLYPLTTIDNRHKFYKEAIPQKWLVAFTHDHERPLAYVEMGERGKLVAMGVGSKLQHRGTDDTDKIKA
jgi:hypothetical protein